MSESDQRQARGTPEREEAMNTHTPGPWRSEFPSRNVVSGPEADICEVYTSDLRKDAESIANARLIAKAPELIDLVQRFARGDMRLPHSQYDMELRQEARALLDAINEPVVAK